MKKHTSITKIFFALAVAALLLGCGSENIMTSEVHPFVPRREARLDLPCIAVICLVDSTGAIVRCDTLDCE